MAQIQCPACGRPMETVTEPDVTYDRCGSCTSIFLDAGELNAMAVGRGRILSG